MPYYPNITIPCGSGGSGNSVTCIVDFAHAISGEQDESDIVTVAASWVTSSTLLRCSGFDTDTTGTSGFGPDHDANDVIVEGVVATVSNIVPGVGFDVQAFAPNQTWGRYQITITGE